MQNSVKYNKPRDGDIIIIVKVKPLKIRDTDQVDIDLNSVLETIIIDTGIGIEKERQNHLFVPFMELKDRLGIMKAENDNIGIGLAGSKDICVKMGGDIILKVSRPGLTAFAFKIPVKVVKPEAEYEVISISEGHRANQDFKVFRLFGTERPIPEIVQDFLEISKVL